MNDNPFETNAHEYDAWYDKFSNTFRSEILAIRGVLPKAGEWVEIGVGTGRFAAELAIPLGIEPAEAMAALASKRGIEVIRGSAEALPLKSNSMDAVFFITALCFVQDLHLALSEAFRILRPGGHCIVGLLPLDSPLGQFTLAHADKDAFFRHANLRTKSEAFQAIEGAGLTIQQTMQTLFGSPEEFELGIQSPISGCDRGSFVVICAARDSQSSPILEQQTNCSS